MVNYKYSIGFKNIHDIHDLIFETSYKTDHRNSKTTTGKRLKWYWNENIQIFFIFAFDCNCWIVSIFWMGIRSAKNSRFCRLLFCPLNPDFLFSHNCNSVYSKRTSDFGVPTRELPSKLAKLLDLIDLMKSVDSDQGDSNANEDQNMKNSRAEESQNFYKTFWILKDFGFEYSRKKFDKSSILATSGKWAENNFIGNENMSESLILTMSDCSYICWWVSVHVRSCPILPGLGQMSLPKGLVPRKLSKIQNYFKEGLTNKDQFFLLVNPV